MDLKQLPGLKKTKMVMYNIAFKLNSTFGTVGKASADKMSEEGIGKLSFCFSMNNLNVLSCSEVWNFEQFLAFS